MSSCSRESSCRSVQKYGIDIVWVKLFSCHVCTSSQKIPFLFIEFDSANKLIPKAVAQYGLKELDHLKNPSAANRNI